MSSAFWWPIFCLAGVRLFCWDVEGMGIPVKGGENSESCFACVGTRWKTTILMSGPPILTHTRTLGFRATFCDKVIPFKVTCSRRALVGITERTFSDNRGGLAWGGGGGGQTWLSLCFP